MMGSTEHQPGIKSKLKSLSSASSQKKLLPPVPFTSKTKTLSSTTSQNPIPQVPFRSKLSPLTRLQKSRKEAVLLKSPLKSPLSGNAPRLVSPSDKQRSKSVGISAISQRSPLFRKMVELRFQAYRSNSNSPIVSPNNPSNPNFPLSPPPLLPNLNDEPYPILPDLTKPEKCKESIISEKIFSPQPQETPIKRTITVARPLSLRRRVPTRSPLDLNASKPLDKIEPSNKLPKKPSKKSKKDPTQETSINPLKKDLIQETSMNSNKKDLNQETSMNPPKKNLTQETSMNPPKKDLAQESSMNPSKKTLEGTPIEPSKEFTEGPLKKLSEDSSVNLTKQSLDDTHTESSKEPTKEFFNGLPEKSSCLIEPTDSNIVDLTDRDEKMLLLPQQNGFKKLTSKAKSKKVALDETQDRMSPFSSYLLENHDLPKSKNKIETTTLGNKKKEISVRSSSKSKKLSNPRKPLVQPGGQLQVFFETGINKDKPSRVLNPKPTGLSKKNYACTSQDKPIVSKDSTPLSTVDAEMKASKANFFEPINESTKIESKTSAPKKDCTASIDQVPKHDLVHTNSSSLSNVITNIPQFSTNINKLKRAPSILREAPLINNFNGNNFVTSIDEKREVVSNVKEVISIKPPTEKIIVHSYMTTPAIEAEPNKTIQSFERSTIEYGVSNPCNSFCSSSDIATIKNTQIDDTDHRTIPQPLIHFNNDKSYQNQNFERYLMNSASEINTDPSKQRPFSKPLNSKRLQISSDESSQQKLEEQCLNTSLDSTSHEEEKPAKRPATPSTILSINSKSTPLSPIITSYSKQTKVTLEPQNNPPLYLSAETQKILSSLNAKCIDIECLTISASFTSYPWFRPLVSIPDKTDNREHLEDYYLKQIGDFILSNLFSVPSLWGFIEVLSNLDVSYPTLSSCERKLWSGGYSNIDQLYDDLSLGANTLLDTGLLLNDQSLVNSALALYEKIQALLRLTNLIKELSIDTSYLPYPFKLHLSKTIKRKCDVQIFETSNNTSRYPWFLNLQTIVTRPTGIYYVWLGTMESHFIQLLKVVLKIPKFPGKSFSNSPIRFGAPYPIIRLGLKGSELYSWDNKLILGVLPGSLFKNQIQVESGRVSIVFLMQPLGPLTPLTLPPNLELPPFNKWARCAVLGFVPVLLTPTEDTEFTLLGPISFSSLSSPHHEQLYSAAMSILSTSPNMSY